MNFGYKTILCSFFFERVHGLCPKVISTINSARDPWMGRWAGLMKQLGCGEVPKTTFDDEFFLWWEQQVIAVEDYPYASMDFQGYLDIMFQPDATWGTIGTNDFSFLNFKIFLDFLSIN